MLPQRKRESERKNGRNLLRAAAIAGDLIEEKGINPGDVVDKCGGLEADDDRSRPGRGQAVVIATES